MAGVPSRGGAAHSSAGGAGAVRGSLAGVSDPGMHTAAEEDEDGEGSDADADAAGDVEQQAEADDLASGGLLGLVGGAFMAVASATHIKSAAAVVGAAAGRVMHPTTSATADHPAASGSAAHSCNGTSRERKQQQDDDEEDSNGASVSRSRSRGRSKQRSRQQPPPRKNTGGRFAALSCGDDEDAGDSTSSSAAASDSSGTGSEGSEEVDLAEYQGDVSTLRRLVIAC